PSHRGVRVSRYVKPLSERGRAVPTLKYQLVDYNMGETVDKKVFRGPRSRGATDRWQRLKQSGQASNKPVIEPFNYPSHVFGKPSANPLFLQFKINSLPEHLNGR